MWKIPAAGIEPATSSLGNQCSIQLSYAGGSDAGIVVDERSDGEGEAPAEPRTSETRGSEGASPSQPVAHCHLVSSAGPGLMTSTGISGGSSASRRCWKWPLIR